MRIAVMEDNQNDSTELSQCLHKYKKIVVDFYHTFNWEKIKNYDAYFLNVNFNNSTGIEIGQMIRSNDWIVPIIFIGKKDEYIYDCFQVHPYYFIVKEKLKVELEICMKDLIPFCNKRKCVFSAMLCGKPIDILLKDIIYINKIHNNCEIHLFNQEIITIQMTLKDILNKDYFGFFQVNQSVIINFYQVRALNPNYTFLLSDGSIIEISRRRRYKVIECYHVFLRSKEFL